MDPKGREEEVETSVDRPVEPQPASPEEQHEETDESLPVTGVGVVTKSMAKGVLIWMVVGAVAGAIAATPFALIPIDAMSGWARLGLFVLVGAIAGGIAGAVYGGGRQPEVEGDVGNQIGPAPLTEENRDPQYVREAVEDFQRTHPE